MGVGYPRPQMRRHVLSYFQVTYTPPINVHVSRTLGSRFLPSNSQSLLAKERKKEAWYILCVTASKILLTVVEKIIIIWVLFSGTIPGVLHLYTPQHSHNPLLDHHSQTTATRKVGAILPFMQIAGRLARADQSARA